MTTANLPRIGCAPAVLGFGARPDGQYPQVLLDDSAGDTVTAPAGGPPMRVLRDPAAVLACLGDHSRPGPQGAPRIVMAGAHPVTGELRGCPLTGAEMQSPDGGLLNMNPPHLTAYRRQLSGLFSAAAAESSRPAAQARATALVGLLAARDHEADVAAGYATPFAATMIVQTLGAGDWPQIKGWSDVAFGVVPSPAAVHGLNAVWAELYAYFRTSLPGGLAAAIAARLTGYTTDQIAHVLATVSNGFGAVPPVLTRVLIELLHRPNTVTACLRGEQSWRAVVRRLIGTRVMFPVALPRLVLADTRLGHHLVEAGTLVLPSLIGAARAGAPATIAFGPGPHFCPGAALTWAWTEVAVMTFFRSFPRARLAGPLDWQRGTLQIPRETRVRLWLRPGRATSAATGNEEQACGQPVPPRAALATGSSHAPGWRAGCPSAPTVARTIRRAGQRRQAGTCELPAGPCAPGPGPRRCQAPLRPAQPDGFRQPAVGQDPPRRLSPPERPPSRRHHVNAAAPAVAWITCRSPPRRPQGLSYQNPDEKVLTVILPMRPRWGPAGNRPAGGGHARSRIPGAWADRTLVGRTAT